LQNNHSTRAHPQPPRTLQPPFAVPSPSSQLPASMSIRAFRGSFNHHTRNPAPATICVYSRFPYHPRHLPCQSVPSVVPSSTILAPTHNHPSSVPISPFAPIGVHPRSQILIPWFPLTHHPSWSTVGNDSIRNILNHRRASTHHRPISNRPTVQDGRTN